VTETRGESNGHGVIDKVYDGLDSFVSGVGRVLGVDVNAQDPQAPAGPSRASVPADRQVASEAAPVPAAQPQLPAGKAPDRAFEIVEVMGRGGDAIAWIVTNGHEKAECGSLAIAKSVLEHLNRALAAKAPKATTETP
jgi:hypothetical protein